MKYVMVEVDHGSFKQRVPVVFPNFMVHSDMAEALTEVLKLKHRFKKVKVVSAGDCNVLEVKCSGRSSTLRLPSLEGDTAIVSTYDYTHGAV